ncbi:HERC2 [Symbiodinium sp. CCMP2456]|nr:HERC2 [Symbiodinium sp. CCMP2456]
MLHNGDFSAALALREGLLATWILSLGNSHTFIATCLNNLGQVHERRALSMENSPARKADIDQAERYYLEALRRRIHLHGEAHVCVGQSWLYLGTLYAKIGRWHDAGKVLADSADILKACQDDTKSLQGLWQLLPRAIAELSMDSGSTRCVKRLQETLFELRPMSPEHKLLQLQFEATSALQAGKYSEAESLVKRYLHQINAEESSEEAGLGCELLATIYMQRRCFLQAERLLDRARDCGCCGPGTIITRAGLLANTFRRKEAVASLRCLLESESVVGHSDLQEVALHNLGSYLIDDGQLKEAEAVMRRCRDLRLESKSIELGSTCTNLGVCILKQSGRERVEEALAFLQEALQLETMLAASSLERRMELATKTFNVAIGLVVQGQICDAELHMIRALEGLVASCCEMAGASSLLQSGTHVGLVRADISILLSLILQFDRQQSVPVLYRLLQWLKGIGFQLESSCLTQAGQRASLNQLESSTDNSSESTSHREQQAHPLSRHEGSCAVLHHGVMCDKCEMAPIKGTRFKCQDCHNYDLCRDCFEQRAAFHQPSHAFTDIKFPRFAETEGEAVAPDAMLSLTQQFAVDTGQIQGALQTDDLLLEYYAYEPTLHWEAFELTRSLRYAVFAITPTTAHVVDLGLASVINGAVEEFRRLIVDDCHSKSDLLTAGLGCYKLLLEAVEPFLSCMKGHLYIAVDGELGRFPFSAVPMNQKGDKFLFDHPSNLSFLISGWALPRLGHQMKDSLLADARRPWAIIGDPSFILEDPVSEESQQVSPSHAHAEDVFRGRGMEFKALRWTAEEVEGVSAEWAGHMQGDTRPRVLTKQDATVQAVLELEAPSVLHFATHGFVLQLTEHYVRCHPHCLVDWPASEAWECDASQYDGGCASGRCKGSKRYRCVRCDYDLCEHCLAEYRYFVRPGNRGNHSLGAGSESRLEEILVKNAVSDAFLRVGLALAGSQSFQNRQDTPPDIGDGLLTGHDILKMRLQDTSLVYLSACELALGSAVYGSGVAGVGRAFLAAGAQNLIMALWDVSDKRSKDIAIGFYKAWLTKGMSMASALRQQQQQLRARYPFRPVVWAAYVFYHGCEAAQQFPTDAAQPQHP